MGCHHAYGAVAAPVWLDTRPYEPDHQLCSWHHAIKSGAVRGSAARWVVRCGTSLWQQRVRVWSWWGTHHQHGLWASLLWAGICYISDRVYTGADTYMDHERHIYEWTEHDSITVGQNGKGPYGEDPCVILYNGRRYLLEGGTCRVIRFSKQGDKLSIGFFRVDVGAFVAHWLTVAEIAELKDITDQEEPEEPGEPEEPEGPVDFPRTEWGILEQMHAKFARTRPATEDGAREWTRMAIEQLAFSFPSGGWCWKSASPDRPPSKDCIARRIEGRFQGWDVLQSAGVNGPHVLARFPPSFHDLIAEGNQHPIPVNSKNHLGTELDEPTEPGQATLDKIYADTQAILALLQKQFK